MFKATILGLSISLSATSTMAATLLESYTVNIPTMSSSSGYNPEIFPDGYPQYNPTIQEIAIPKYSGSADDLVRMNVSFSGTTNGNVLVVGGYYPDDEYYSNYHLWYVSSLEIEFPDSNILLRRESLSGKSGIPVYDQVEEINFTGFLSNSASATDSFTLGNYSGGGSVPANVLYAEGVYTYTLSIDLLEQFAEFENGSLVVEYFGAEIPEPTTIIASLLIGNGLMLIKRRWMP